MYYYYSHVNGQYIIAKGITIQKVDKYYVKDVKLLYHYSHVNGS